jgi:predicted GIY-YIG superfamily endonuclease
LNGAFSSTRKASGSLTDRVNRLVYCQEFNDIAHAIARDNEIKSMTRKQKLKLI